MLWVHGHYAYVYSAGIDFRRQNLTSTGLNSDRLIRVNTGFLCGRNQSVGLQNLIKVSHSTLALLGTTIVVLTLTTLN